MKKRLVIFGIVALLLVAMAVPALAATDNPQLTWFKQRMDARKAYIDQAVQNGQITEEQGEIWKDHFDQMTKFHEENGFLGPCGGPGMGPGAGRGFGGGMMRGWGGGQGGPGWQANQSSQ